ncbi:MAG: type 1 glutamine amidotransferase [Chloroflexi bacterium]|nr:type 1 glutamine amidotransferase [Chloroflexota bacterium]OJV94628.1 MAG: hypothetical protein BGO39_23140 [Chloroflexi bacterium 54-19]
MADTTLNGLRVAILATDDFEQVELVKPKQALDQAGAITKIISPQPKNGQVVGFNHDTKGDTFKVDLPLEQANPAEFDAVLLPGGALNADNLRVNRQAQDFVRQVDQAGKPIAVICHAPWLLVSAGLVRGRKLTSYHTIQDDVRNAGGQWEDSQVVQDRNWVSSRQPDDIPAFNQAMLNLFSKGVYGNTSQNSAETLAPEGAYTSESLLGDQSTTEMTGATGHEENLKGQDDVLIHGEQH